MRNLFARLASRDVARLSLRDRAAALKASAARVIRRKPAGVAEVHPDAALLAAAERARPFIKKETMLEAEFRRLDAITDDLAVQRFGVRPDPRDDWEGMQAYDEKREALRVETGRQAAWAVMSENSQAVWDLLGPFAELPTQTVEGAAAKTLLVASELWDGETVAREIAALLLSAPAACGVVRAPADPVLAAIARYQTVPGCLGRLGRLLRPDQGSGLGRYGWPWRRG